MKSKFINQKIKYDGSQLSPLFAYKNFKILGSSIVSFLGPCRVGWDHMVDAEDLIQKSEIKSDLMLHFIIESFEANLFSAVALQRLFASMLHHYLLVHVKNINTHQFIREGDDIYFIDGKKKKKLSISIASVSAVSSMVHFAVNVTTKGTPVLTTSLEELNLSSKKLANDMMKLFVNEYATIIEATQKVKPLY